MRLIQTFKTPLLGYWDGGPKSVFNWEIDGEVKTDKQGRFVRVGSWEANNWFHVAVGKTLKMTLGNARRRLSYLARRAGKACTFAYSED